MSVVRCRTCGEIVDAGPELYCWGCGKPVSEADASSELRLPAATREARRDIGVGDAVLTTLGVLVLAGLLGVWGWPPAIILILVVVIILAFARSVAGQRAADSGPAAAVAGILTVVVRVFAVIFIVGLILVVGAFVFIYIVCLSQEGGRGGWWG